MNTPRGFDERTEHEWDAQERAMREERTASGRHGDARNQQYRFIARALANPPLDAPDAHFARDVAAHVEGLEQVADERLESWLVRGLIALLVLAGLVSAYVFGDQWRGAWLLPVSWVQFASSPFVGWSLLAAACLGLSSAFERLSRNLTSRGGHV